MGRRTWDSLPEKSRPLSGRTHIVITSQKAWAAAGAVRASSLSHAPGLGAAVARPGDRLRIIGGGRVYSEAVNVAGAAVITVIDKVVPGDTYAPTVGPEWVLATVDPAEDWQTAADGTRYRFLDTRLSAGKENPRSRRSRTTIWPYVLGTTHGGRADETTVCSTGFARNRWRGRLDYHRFVYARVGFSRHGPI